MKAVVLAGGKGSRLRPFTYSGAKQLLPIGNTPVLFFALRQIAEAGITDIAIVVGDTAEQVMAAAGDGSAFGARFTYLRQPAPLGIAHALGLARDFAAGEPVLLYLGDNMLRGGIRDFVDRFRASDAAGAVIVRRVPNPTAFGVAVFEDGRLVRVVEKPAEPPTDFAVVGIYAFRPIVFDVVAAQRPSARGELEIADTINGLLERGCRIDVTLTEAEWVDTGKMEDTLAANRIVLEDLVPSVSSEATLEACRLTGVVVVEAGAVIERSELIGPVAVAAGARIRDSRVGPYVSVGPGASISRSEVTNAIIMERASIERCAGLTASMIGREAKVTGLPAGASVTLGDHSAVELP
ncbi:MAG: glucose-1-phosphate thymidylyltransferase [Chloroflexota bacterium]|nr:glucose-1-phosphate thymidylyltransferase [Chloroflexota bacterium]